MAQPAESTSGRKLLSIVVPVFNEEANIDALYQALTQTLAPESSRYDLEFVFTDNHSTDSTFQKLKDLAGRDKRVRVFRFSRNFGFQMSVFEGYRRARGDAAVEIDADLQDPPAIIIDFLRLWEQGFHVVYGIRTERQEGRLINAARHCFYRLVQSLSDDHLPPGAGDFRLIDRRIIDELSKIRDPNIYIRGRIGTLGFRQTGVPYARDRRKAGASKFNFASMAALAIDAITSHSVLPLRLATFCGLIAAIVSLLMMIGYTIAHFYIGVTWPPGFTTLTVLIAFSIALNSIFLGIIGEYLARIYQHLKRSASVIVEESIDPHGDAGPR